MPATLRLAGVLALALLLVACGGVTVPARQDPAPQASYAPEGEIRGQILAVHGFNDHKGAFAEFGRFAAARGYRLIAYDQPSFGEQEGRGSWPGSDALAHTLHRQLADLRGADPGLPVYVLGESMGAAVTTMAMTRPDAPALDGVILLAPAAWGGNTLHPFYRVALSFADTFFPGLELTGERLEVLPSDNIPMLRELSRDPLYIKATKVHAIAGLVAVMDEARLSAPHLKVPALVLVGARDEIVPPAVQRSFAGLLGAESCTLVDYPEGWHMLLRDLQRPTVWEDVLAWLDGSPLPSGLAKPCRPNGNPSTVRQVADWRGTPPDGSGLQLPGT